MIVITFPARLAWRLVWRRNTCRSTSGITYRRDCAHVYTLSMHNTLICYTRLKQFSALYNGMLHHYNNYIALHYNNGIMHWDYMHLHFV